MQPTDAAYLADGTFKDRWLVRRNPYQVVEGLAIAASIIEADRAFIAIKRAFGREIRVLRRAIAAIRLQAFFERRPPKFRGL